MNLMCLGKAFESFDKVVLFNQSDLFVVQFLLNQTPVTIVTIKSICCLSGNRSCLVTVENKSGKRLRVDAIESVELSWDSSSSSYLPIYSSSCFDDDVTGLSLIEFVEFISPQPILLLREQCTPMNEPFWSYDATITITQEGKVVRFDCNENCEYVQANEEYIDSTPQVYQIPFFDPFNPPNVLFIDRFTIDHKGCSIGFVNGDGSERECFSGVELVQNIRQIVIITPTQGIGATEAVGAYSQFPMSQIQQFPNCRIFRICQMATATLEVRSRLSDGSVDEINSTVIYSGSRCEIGNGDPDAEFERPTLPSEDCLYVIKLAANLSVTVPLPVRVNGAVPTITVRLFEFPPAYLSFRGPNVPESAISAGMLVTEGVVNLIVNAAADVALRASFPVAGLAIAQSVDIFVDILEVTKTC